MSRGLPAATLLARFGISAHPRSIERSLLRYSERQQENLTNPVLTSHGKETWIQMACSAYTFWSYKSFQPDSERSACLSAADRRRANSCKWDQEPHRGCVVALANVFRCHCTCIGHLFRLEDAAIPQPPVPITGESTIYGLGFVGLLRIVRAPVPQTIQYVVAIALGSFGVVIHENVFASAGFLLSFPAKLRGQ
jgi:hypothetical protein